MKILHVIDHMDLGGAQEIVLGLKKIDDSEIFSLKHTASRNITSSNSTNKYSPLPFFDLLRFINRNSDIEIIQAHLIKSKIFALIISIFKKDVLLIFHEHGVIKNKVYFSFLKLAALRVNHFVMVNEKDAIEIRNKLSIKKARCIPNFVQIKSRYESKEFKYNIGLIGRLTYQKGFDLFLENYKKTDHNNFEIHIYGEGPQKKYLINLVKKLNLNNVQFHPVEKDKKKIYKDLGIVVMPSKYESFGLVALEAMAFGVPVLASRTGGLLSIIQNEKNGLFINIKSHKSISKSLDKLMNPNYRNRLIINGYKTADKFSYKKIIGKWKEFYREILTPYGK